MITVTINVRDLDPTVGPVPTWPTVSFARLVPSTAAGTLITTEPVQANLDSSGQGSMQLAPSTAYEVRCSGLSGFDAPFTVLTGAANTSLAALWQTGQIDPASALPLPVVPASTTALLLKAEQLLAQITATSPVALTQAAYDALTVKDPNTLYLITT